MKAVVPLAGTTPDSLRSFVVQKQFSRTLAATDFDSGHSIQIKLAGPEIQRELVENLIQFATCGTFRRPMGRKGIPIAITGCGGLW